jgi:hypothetical protein
MTQDAHRKRGLMAVLVCLCLLAVPLAASANAATSRTDRKQNAAIKKHNAAIKKNAAAAKKLAATIKALGTSLGTVDGRLKGIEAAAPTLISSLTQLADGLGKLQTGLETAGGKLTTLGSAYQAVEFGRAALTPGDSDLTIAAGGAGTSGDIPDDGNAISIGDDAVVVAGGSATTETLDLRALIRSAEPDGATSSTTAGQAGGFLQLANADTGAKVPCTGAPNPPGILGTAAGDSIVTPSGTVTNLPIVNIPGGNVRTSTVEPTGSNGVNLFPVALPACSFTATPGTTYRAHWSVQFLDIPTSTTPGPDE